MVAFLVENALTRGKPRDESPKMMIFVRSKKKRKHGGKRHRRKSSTDTESDEEKTQSVRDFAEKDPKRSSRIFSKPVL